MNKIIKFKNRLIDCVNNQKKANTTDGFDDETLNDRQYYESMPIDELGTEGCCKAFCKEYIKVDPTAQIWAVKDATKKIWHTFIFKGGTAFDIRGSRKPTEMKVEEDDTVTELTDDEFSKYSCWADRDVLLHEIASVRFKQALEANPEKYGLAQDFALLRPN